MIIRSVLVRCTQYVCTWFGARRPYVIFYGYYVLCALRPYGRQTFVPSDFLFPRYLRFDFADDLHAGAYPFISFSFYSAILLSGTENESITRKRYSDPRATLSVVLGQLNSARARCERVFTAGAAIPSLNHRPAPGEIHVRIYVVHYRDESALAVRLKIIGVNGGDGRVFGGPLLFLAGPRS
jgi:hypothetical protein